MVKYRARFILRLALGALWAGSAASAQIDNDVQWYPLSHVGTADRRPICPINRQSFEVRFQTGRIDLTSARVGVDDGADGAGIVWIDAVWLQNRGPYDIWRATVPASASSRTAYVIEFSDGTDRDYLSNAGVTEDVPPAPDWWVLDFVTLDHAPAGATPTIGGTVFRVWAPGAASATVRGTFNNWGNTVLTRRGEYFVGYVPGAAAGQRYKYFFNGNEWKPDARARSLDSTDSYNSVIVDPLEYQWRQPDFSPVPRDRWVIYQLHVGTFAGLNDPLGSFARPARFREVAARAGHLQDLGVNAVMLNPVNEFPGELSGGYNPISMWAFERTYGSSDDLKFLVDELHTRGIAVLLDVVWNHFASNDNFLWFYDGTQAYFDNPAVGTQWGPQADLDRQPVFDYFLDSVEHTLGEYNFDGLRQDGFTHIVGESQHQAGQRLMRAMSDQVHRRFADSHVIAEVYSNSDWNTSPAGMNLDGQYHEAFRSALRDAVWAAAFGDPDVARLALTIDGSGPWVEGDRVLNYFELHDEAWTLSGGSRAVRQIDPTPPHDDLYAKGRTKLANGTALLSKGMPAVLQGTEWLEDNGWEQEKIDWSNRVRYSGVFQFYRDIIHLRTTESALFANSGVWVYHVNENANVIGFERYVADGASFVIITNFSNTNFSEYIIGVPRPGRWGVVLNSEDDRYQGSGFGSLPGCVPVESAWRDGMPQRVRVQLPAHGLLILRHEPPGPTITDQPESATICPSGVASYSVGTADSGGSGVAYRWQWRPPADGVGDLPWLDVLAGVNNDGPSSFEAGPPNAQTLNVQHLGMHAGIGPRDLYLRVRCVVTDSCGQTESQEAELTVCRADWNCADGIDSQDIFDFLESFFAGNGDFNGTDGVDSQDFFEFLEAFFGGC